MRREGRRPFVTATSQGIRAVVLKVGVGIPLGVARDFRWGPQNDFQNIFACNLQNVHVK